jgi:hypothetical protein
VVALTVEEALKKTKPLKHNLLISDLLYIAFRVASNLFTRVSSTVDGATKFDLNSVHKVPKCSNSPSQSLARGGGEGDMRVFTQSDISSAKRGVYSLRKQLTADFFVGVLETNLLWITIESINYQSR